MYRDTVNVRWWRPLFIDMIGGLKFGLRVAYKMCYLCSDFFMQIYSVGLAACIFFSLFNK
jgi:hypothetical protein